MYLFKRLLKNKQFSHNICIFEWEQKNTFKKILHIIAEFLWMSEMFRVTLIPDISIITNSIKVIFF